MRTSTMQRTLLHLEDDFALAKLVRVVFEKLGFQGDMLQVGCIAEAIALLLERERTKAPLDLILTDMQLPDGTGLDFLRQVKSRAAWHMTPVIVLSGDTAPGTVAEAYALGANCYLSKQFTARGGLNSFQALYKCWIEGALLPKTTFPASAQGALYNAVRLKARTAQFYLGLAGTCAGDPIQEKFWLERALVEGNMSNLMAFLEDQITDEGVPPEVIERVGGVQHKLEKCLDLVEALLATNPHPGATEVCRWIVDLAGSLDEEVFVEVYGILLLKNPTVTAALKARAVNQLWALAEYVLNRSQDYELRQRSEALLAIAGKLAVL